MATDALGQSGDESQTVTIAADPTIAAPLTGTGEIGVPYDSVPAATGGSGTDTWSVTDGTLPDGLSLDPTTGEVTGSPTSSGLFTFDLVATDSLGQSGDESQTITIAGDPTITAPLTGTGEVGVPYDSVPAAAGGSGTYTWSVTDGTLPDGLSLDPTTGEVTGTPTTAGPSTFNLVATDSLGQSGRQSESITIAADPTIAAPLTGTGEVGRPLRLGPGRRRGLGHLHLVGDRRHPARRPQP